MAIHIPTRPRNQSDLVLKRSSTLVGVRNDAAAHDLSDSGASCSVEIRLTAEERHALIRTVMSSMAIEGVFVPEDMAQRALETSLAGLATGQRRLGRHTD